MNFQEVITKLNKFAPLTLGESWDNVGLLVEPPEKKIVSKILLTNDLTLDVMDEAEVKGIDMILSYHPPIFSPLKRITTSHWKQIIVGRCLAKGIAIYSPHTCYDALKGGVNDWLIQAFGDGNVKPVNQSYEKGSWSHQVEVNVEDSNGGLNTISQKLKENIPANGVTFLTAGNQIKILCNENHLPIIVCTMSQVEMEKIPSYTIMKLDKDPIFDHGQGRISKLQTPISLAEAVKKVKSHLGLSYVRLALKHGGTLDEMINIVAVCAGSGASVLQNIKADLLLTGEMSHHGVLECTQKGSSVILTDHSNSERGFLKSVLKPTLTTIFDGNVEVIVSERDSDPLKVI